MATFAADDVEKHIKQYRIKLEKLKERKLQKFDARNNSTSHDNNGETREEYIEKLENIIEKRMIDAENKAKRLLSKHNDLYKYDPYRILNLVDDGKVSFKKDYKAKDVDINTEKISNKSVKKENESADGSAINWSELFENPNNPLVVDAGCGSGKFLLRFAWEDKNKNGVRNKNFLGIEIRKGLVDKAMGYRNKLGYHNVCYVHAEFNKKFILEKLKQYPGTINILCCQMPDPRFQKNMKRRGKKKLTLERIIQPPIVEAISNILDPENGLIYVSSEYEEVYTDMKECFLKNSQFQLANIKEIKTMQFKSIPYIYDSYGLDTAKTEELSFNPFGCETERELYLREFKKDTKIWRAVLKMRSISAHNT